MTKAIGLLMLKLFGWKKGEAPPQEDKYVLIASPHTTNWDFPFMMMYAFIYGMNISWMGKQALFRWPWGWFFKLMGGLPVNRTGSNNLVQQLAETFQEHDKLILVIPSAGTRSYRDYWKSGFYFIAKEAGVPIVPGYLDYKNKVGGFGPPLHPTVDLVADMDVLREFYKDKAGKYPEKTSRIRLRQEDEEQPTK
jgi:1-acyl-sn-glycerol-3-phosphate acyltransferase